MHEYALVSALIDRVERELAAHPGAIARVVRVLVGEQAGVELELLRTAYETCRAGGPCRDAELAIRAEPAAWQCAACGRALPPGAILRCCDRPARMTAGGDLVLERIELEVPDDPEEATHV